MSRKPSYDDLIKRVNALEAQLHQGCRMENIFHAAAQPVLILSPTQEILAANLAAEKATGFSGHQLIGQKCYHVMHGPHYQGPPTACPMARMLDSQHAETIEMEIESLDSVFLVACTPIFDKDGHLDRVIHIATDITAQKQSQAQLLKSETQFRFLTENMADMLWTTDLTFRATYSSPSIEKMFGFTPEERQHQSGQEIMTPESYARAMELLLKELSREGQAGVDPQRSSTIEIENYTKEGATRWVENNVRFRRDSENKIIGLMGVSRDISDRKKTEAALREGEEKYRHLMTHAPTGIIETDLQGRLTLVNQKIFDQFQFSQSDFDAGLTAFEFIHPDDRKRALFNFGRIINGERIGFAEYEMLRKDGTTFSALIHPSPIFHKGQMAGLRGFVVDISEKKNIEAKLRVAQKMEAIGTLAGGVAHEFNNILGIIIGNTELAMEDIPEGNRAGNNLKEVYAASLRAKEVVRQILRFVRKIPSEKKPVQAEIDSINALELFRADPSQFDLVITDMAMPQMEGDRLAQELIKIRPDIPIILCTGHSDRIDETLAAGLGIRAAVIKPLVKAELAKTIRKVLEGAP